MRLATSYVYKVDDEQVACCNLTLDQPLDNCAIVDLLMVEPRWRRQGIASRLLQYVMAEADKAGVILFIDAWPLEMDQISPEALERFYRKLGFKEATIKKRLQRNPIAHATDEPK